VATKGKKGARVEQLEVPFERDSTDSPEGAGARRSRASDLLRTQKQSTGKPGRVGTPRPAGIAPKGRPAADASRSGSRAPADKASPVRPTPDGQIPGDPLPEPLPRARAQKAQVGRSAADLATKQRDISVSEFFAKNRHLLGFDNPSKALLTTVREAVDNSLDACEEAQILPDLHVEIVPQGEERFRVIVQDNGPGIVRAQVPKIFGQLLYGSKFHTLKQSRGQQGIGISAAGMYGMLTSGRPMVIVTRTGARQPAHYMELRIDTQRNRPEVLIDKEVPWDVDHGTRVEITLSGTYKKGRHSVDGYLRQVAIANPHARISYLPPSSDGPAESMVFDRVSKDLPPEPKEIKPHPYGVELGVLLKMLKATEARTLRSFLQVEFSRISPRTADEIASKAGVGAETKPARIALDGAEHLHKAMNETKIMAPPTNCIVPIGEDLLARALEQELEADFYAVVSRPPTVYRGNPFLIEAGLAWGGDLPAEEPFSLYRYANRVPLLYQQSACAITKAVIGTDWKNYQITQPRGALPVGPAILLVHIASAWVPFTSESKESIAHYPEILKEIRLALQECGRRLALHINRTRREHDEGKKRSYIQRYIPHIGIALQQILKLSDTERERTVATLTDVLERSRTGADGGG
jgi:DNA topoisomerase VI subunit B